MADGNENVTKETVNVPRGLTHLSGMLAGLPGAEKILQDTAKEAVESGIITVDGGQEDVAEDQGDGDEQIETPKNDPVNKKEDKKSTPAKAENLSESDDDQEEDDLGDEEANNPLLKALKGKDKKNEISFENFDQIKAHTKKVLGIDVKSEKDFNKVFKSATQWRQEAAKVPELETKVEQLSGIFDNMPSQLLDSVKSYYNGEGDWDRHIVDKPRFDFKKSADKQDEKALVNHYFPNKFTSADWSADTIHPGLEIAIESSKTQYNNDKRELENSSATMLRQSQEKLEIMKSSATSSLKNLKQSFPDLDNAEIKQIQKILDSGDINSLFFDKKGGFKEDAAEKLLLAIHGKGTIKSMMKLSANRAETKTNEDILTRGSDKPKPGKGGVSPKQVSVNVNKAIDALVGGLNTKKTY